MLLALATGSSALALPETELVALKLPQLGTMAAIDKDVKLGFYLRPDLALENPTGYRVSFPLDEIGPGGIRRRQYFFLSAPGYPAGIRAEMHVSEVISLDLAGAFSTLTNDILKGLFPSRAASTTDDSSLFEVLVIARMNSKWAEDSTGDISGLEVHLQFELVSSEGERIDLVSGSGSAQPEQAMYWSTATRWRSVGLMAMTRAFDKLVVDLRASEPLRLHLGKLAEARALPARLETVASFDDSTAFLPNGRLDAGEQAVVKVEVTNHGPGPAYEVGVGVGAVSDLSQLSLPASVSLGTLLPRARGQVTLPVAGKLDLQTQLLRLRLETTEKRGYDARPLVLEVAADALLPARLEVVDVAWNDGTGRALGDGDGRPANGETLEAVVRVRNAGPGEAARIAVSATPSKPGVDLLAPTTVLDRIAANEVAEARLLLRLPAAYPETDLQLVFAAVDSRGPAAGRASHTESWQVRTRRPSLGVTHRLFDGSSPSSLGNRDGEVNNGERVELALTAFNRGEMAAQGAQLAVVAEDPGVVLTPSTFTIGSLPPLTAGVEQRLTITVPRELGREGMRREIRFAVTISQQDFPAVIETVALPFHVQLPDVIVDAATETVVRGAQRTVTLQLHNRGELAAEEVVVEVTANAAGVELLDDRGVPGTRRRYAIGTLAPRSAGQRLTLPVLAKQGAAVGAAPLGVAILQRGFPPASQSIDLRIAEGEVPVIASLVAPAAARPSSSTAAPAPATISFLHSTGDRLSDEAFILRFEVQAGAEPTDVRLTQNDRQLPLAAARRTSSRLGSREVWQYAVPVQLDPGENHFEVIVVTREGIRSDRPLSLVREQSQGRLWVVAIGVGRYADPKIDELSYAAADAVAVHRYFRDTFALPAEQALLRTDSQATLREIKSLLGTQLGKLANNPDDTIVVYFAGHGIAEGGAGSLDADRLSKYLLPHDAVLADPYSTALDMDEITNIARRLIAGRVVVLVDSCFSGAAGGRSPFDPGRDRRRAAITDEFLARMGSVGSGRVVLTASGPNEIARERDDLRHGVFTYYLLKGMEGAGDGDRDGDVDVDELYRYVSREVASATGGKQHPFKAAAQATGEILIGRSSPAVAPAAALAPATSGRP